MKERFLFHYPHAGIGIMHVLLEFYTFIRKKPSIIGIKQTEI